VQEDDPRYLALATFLENTLRDVGDRWHEWRKRHEVKKLMAQSPALRGRLDQMSEGHRKSAETLIAQLGALPVDDDEDRRLLYRHGVYAFERMKLRGSEADFAKNVLDIEQTIKMLGDRDTLEAALYRDIVRSRLAVIRQFQNLADADAKEKILQRYLFDHLWLLDPAWERATGSELMETRLLEAGVIVDDLDEKERLARVDIKYRTISGKHVIVELKKVRRVLDLNDLTRQGSLYVDKIKKILLVQQEASPNIEIVFVLGAPIKDEIDNPERVKLMMAGVSPGSRIMHYDALIDGACRAYASYLERSRELDKLDKIIEAL